MDNTTFWTDDAGHEHATCTRCGVDCSTHPDAGNSLDCCADCGHATCPDCRDYINNAPICVDCLHARALQETDMTKIDRLTQVLTADEIIALTSYAAQNGRTWKAALREAWMTASEPGLLQQLRNASYFGPRGLKAFQVRYAALWLRPEERVAR